MSLSRDSSLFPTYRKLPLDIDRGEGVYLFTKDGRRYLDMVAGLAVNALGHRHPAVLEAVMHQLERNLHVSNNFRQEIQEELAARLLGATGYARVFLCNSGTEAMEAALKLVRRWGKAENRSDILGFSGSFHGRTLGSLSVTGREQYRQGYEPFLPGTSILPFNNVEALEKSVNDRTLAVALEFIQGEGGIRPVTPAFVDALEHLRIRFGFLVIADEVQSGIGRTGKFLACEHFAFRPDIVLLAKAIGGGLPLGAMIAGEKLAKHFGPGSHGSTFGGNPVACAAGIAVLKELYDGGVLQNAAEAGDHLLGRLRRLLKNLPGLVAEVRGHGLMAGVELRCDASSVVDQLLERGVILNATDTTVLRWLPPLIVKTHEIDEAVNEVEKILFARKAL